MCFGLTCCLFLAISAQAAVTLDRTSTDKASSTTGLSSLTRSRTVGNRRTSGGLESRAAANPTSTFTVNTNLDDESNGCAVGNCTLREAINDANNTPQPDTINFAPTVTGSITLTSGQLIASSDITINGPGARVLSINGNNTDRVFLVATPLFGGDIAVSISGLTITNGSAQPVLIGSTIIGDGGGILNGALLGILSGTSTLDLTEVTVNGNQATTLGGGIATRLNAITNITRSTISNNVSNAIVPDVGGDVGGGGISNVVGITTITNSTISNNNSLAAGGGILNAAGILNLTNNTITNNDSTLAGGGVVSVIGVLTPILGVANVRNTIIANNNDLLGTNILGRDVVGVLGSFNSLGNNLIGSNFGAEVNFTASLFVGITPQPNVNGDIVGNVVIGNQVIDPLLSALQNNGGQTNTRLPQTGSPAIDRGNNCVLTNSCSISLPFALTIEQRGAGFARLRGGAVEIGAVEAAGPTAAAVSISGRVTQSNGKGIFRAAVTLTDSTGKVLTATTDFRGNYSFDSIEVQRTYILEVRHKQYNFTPQIITPGEDLLGINIIGTLSDETILSAFKKSSR